MKRLFVLTFLLACGLSAHALTKVTFMPQWTPQTQFAGFYMALEKGFYEEEGLDVTISHIGVNSTESILDNLLAGKAQIVGQQLLQGIVARADGKPIVNVLQLSQKSGLRCVSHHPISKPEQLDGLKVGRWKIGYSEFCDLMEVSNGIHVDWVPFINGINLFLFGAVDATLCYSYSEYVALRLAMGDIPDDNVIKFSDFGYECPEDGLYVTDEYYRNNKETVDAFVRASIRGWDYVRGHHEEAVDLTMRYVTESSIVTNRVHQSLMLEEYLDLHVNPVTGAPDYAPVNRDIFHDMISGLFNTGFITTKPEYRDCIK